ncbi:hypothetical protein AU476_29930 [Cupriavidus sp. UYMSc13B]|nr:hypothetical protein AU476_29930 [Cupriavidus sp. UYMSc13B]
MLVEDICSAKAVHVPLSCTLQEAAVQMRGKNSTGIRRLTRRPSAWRSMKDRVRTIIGNVLRAGRALLTEPEAKAVLAAYGLPIVETRTAASVDEAVDQAGYPVALIILSPDISHKSAVGGVALDLADAAAVRSAMLERIWQQAPEARVEGFSVQPMVWQGAGFELIIGAATDPVFGPFLLFGHGGVNTERDVHARYFCSFREPEHGHLARLTQIDHSRETAFIATTTDACGENSILGEVRAVADPDNVRAEFGIAVCSDCKGKGLGRPLLDKMIRYARKKYRHTGGLHHVSQADAGARLRLTDQHRGRRRWRQLHLALGQEDAGVTD